MQYILLFQNDFSMKSLIADFQTDEKKKKNGRHEINLDSSETDLLDLGR